MRTGRKPPPLRSGYMDIEYKGQKIAVIKSRRSGNKYGMSRYRNVIAVWDEDYDTRVLTFIDDFLSDTTQRMNLIAAHEAEGTLELLFFGFIPDEFREGKTVECENDVWTIIKSERTSFEASSRARAI